MKNFQMQVEAERKKRAMILESEGICEAEKNKAEGEKQGRILRSEAQMQEQVCHINNCIYLYYILYNI